MKIAIIQCPVWGTYDPPLALALLSGALKEAGHEVFVSDLNIKLYQSRKESYKNMWAWEQCSFWYDEHNIDLFFSDNRDQIDMYVEKIVDFGPRVVGFSVNTASLAFSALLAKKLKKACKGVKLVFGGQLFFEEKYTELVLKQGLADIVVPSEGEFVFPELVDLLAKRRSLSSCAGICYRQEGKIHSTQTRKAIASLGELPFMDFSDLKLTDYDDSQHLALMASRGCVQSCVFCSSRSFWHGFRFMSGERIFREMDFQLRYQKKLGLDIGHIDFMDLMFNGNIKALSSFCELAAKSDLRVKWSANMIVRPEMTKEIIRSMRQSGCEHIIFGIESGSQRVLGLMKKRYRIQDADNIIRWMHEEGITVTGNFMFGFPGETEEDFQETLDFLKRNAEYLDRAYPSRTYCALEQFSYLNDHLKEFDIKSNPPNHLYWESMDGKNTYPVRLGRCERFCELATSLGIEAGCGVQTSVDLDRWYNLGFYYECVRDYPRAVLNFGKYCALDPNNKLVSARLKSCAEQLEKDGEAAKQVLSSLKAEDKARGEASSAAGDRESLQRGRFENERLNEKEFLSRRVVLASTPQVFVLQGAGSSVSSCVFCPKDNSYGVFDLGQFKLSVEQKIYSELKKTGKIILSGFGGSLSMQQRIDILAHFDNSFPQAQKMLIASGPAIDPDVSNWLINSNGEYAVYFLLNASNAESYASMTGSQDFYKILGQLHYLLKNRQDKKKVGIKLVFVATSLNIEDLPRFIYLAKDLGVDAVHCHYRCIHSKAQEHLSCHLKQDLTNRKLTETVSLAKNLKVEIGLPPQFGLEEYPILELCRQPWAQIMFNAEGEMMPCGTSGDPGMNLKNFNFPMLWNSGYYKELRRRSADGDSPCARSCLRGNPAAVNEFSDHTTLQQSQAGAHSLA